jgi:radical SAM superfamily enzyme
LANQWRHGAYQPLSQSDYVTTVVEMIKRTPSDVIFHRLTGTASDDILLAPLWCGKKWAVLNAIEQKLCNQRLKHTTRKPLTGMIRPATSSQSVSATTGEQLWS